MLYTSNIMTAQTTQITDQEISRALASGQVNI